MRQLSIPLIRNQGVPGALKLVLEPSLRRTFNRNRLDTGRRSQHTLPSQCSAGMRFVMRVAS